MFDPEEDDFEICPDCGTRHPSRDDIYLALVNDHFDKGEGTRTVSLGPPDLYMIINASQDLLKSKPGLAPRVHTLATYFIYKMVGIEQDLDRGIPPTPSIEFELNLPQHCLITFALEEVILQNEGTEIAEDVSALYERLMELI